MLITGYFLLKPARLCRVLTGKSLRRPALMIINFFYSHPKASELWA
jgi:hypothetical protein